jgi:hypothetical protein
MAYLWRSTALLLAAYLLAGCGVRRVPSPPPAPVQSAPPRGEHYLIDCAASTVRVLVRREGPLAALGHNHVLLMHPSAGELGLDPANGAARGTLEFPVEAIVVDDPAERSGAGPEFPGAVPADDIAGTRRNLLGPGVLDAAHWPRLQVEIGALSGGPERYTAEAVLSVRGQRTPATVRLLVARSDETVIASGDLELSQRALGLEPFSVLFGALRVADRLETQFRFVLRPRSQMAPAHGCGT